MGNKPLWPSRPLGELIENLDYLRVPVKGVDRKHGPYPYYGASGIVDYVDNYIFDGEHLLIAEDGENLRTQQTPIAFMAKGRFWVNNHAHIVRGNENNLTLYLMYALLDTDVRPYLTGSTMPKLTQANLNRILIAAPPLSEQRAIAHILGTLDDKIELNRRMNETLESMARALFKAWFVDFEPVRAKAEGRDTGLPPHLAKLFPSRLVNSELGEVPEGWNYTRLGKILSVIETGGRPKGGVRDILHGVPSVGAESIVGIGQFDFGKTKYVPTDYFASMKKGIVAPKDVLLYKDGGRPGEYEPHLTMVDRGFPFETFCINEHVYRLRSDPLIPQTYLYFWLSSDSSMDEMRVRGTGVAIPGLNSTAVRELTILNPPTEVLQAFDKLVSPLTKRIFTNSNESRTLAALRDALLPKLVSGELRVHEMGGVL